MWGFSYAQQCRQGSPGDIVVTCYDIHMERKVPFEIGEFYHVYNRGVDKRKIFFVDRDWDIFQWLLYVRNSDKRIDLPKSSKNTKSPGVPWRQVDTGNKLVDIITYAFMDNHFHLLLKEKQEGGISKFMSRLMTSYSMYMNKKYDRSGPLMCRPFRSRHINSDEYLRWVISYIHLNPIDQIEPKWKDVGISDLRSTQKFLKKYKYSSYQDYFTNRQGSPGDEIRQECAIINKDALPIDISDLDNLKEMLKEYFGQRYLEEDIGID